MESDCKELDDALAFTFFQHDDGPYFDMDLALPGFSSRADEPAAESEEFEFSISISAAAAGRGATQRVDDVSPADDLFYKGQLLPLHLPPRLQMVRNLSLPREAAPNENNDSNDNNGIAATSSDCCIRPTEGSDDSRIKDSLHDTLFASSEDDSSPGSSGSNRTQREKTPFPFLRKSATKLIKVSLFGFRKSSKVGMDERSEPAKYTGSPKRQRFTVKLKSVKAPSVPFFAKDSARKLGGSGSRKRSEHWFSNSHGRPSGGNAYGSGRSAREVVQKYFKLVKPLYDKISQKHDEQPRTGERPCAAGGAVDSLWERRHSPHPSFSGNLKMRCRHFGVESCPPSMNSSPSHSGVLNNFYADSSTMLDLHNSIQGAIAHCKKSNGIVDARNSEGPC